MLDFFRRLFDTSDFMPRRHCGTWTDELVWLHRGSDLAIWLAYLAIPIVILYFVRRRPGMPFHWMGWLFAAFIVACGTTHLVDAFMFEYPIYRASGLVKLATAAVSWTTVVALIPTTPRALALPELGALNRELRDEIARRERAERALREREREVRARLEELEAIYSKAPIGLSFVDRDLRFVRVNERLAAMNGRSVAEHVGRRPSEVVAAHAQVAEQHLARAIETGETATDILAELPADSGVPVLRRLASVHPLRDGHGEIIGAISVVTDITERSRHEQALRDSESRLRAIVDTAVDAIITIDDEGTIESVNGAAERMFGYSSSELVGRNVMLLMPERFQGEHRTNLARYLRTGERRVIGIGREVVGRTRDGREFALHISISEFAVGGRRMFTGIARDIGDMQRVQRELRDRAEALARSNAELEQFAYVASHDLREPLRMISSFTSLLQRRYRGRLDSDADEFIGFAVEGAQRMQALIDGLLSLSRLGTQPIELKPIPVDLALDSALSNLRVAIEESGAAVTRDPLPTALGDWPQLVQLFQNLIGNAVKFRGAEPARVHVSAAREGVLWRFVVADNGIGIAPEHRERVFGLFQRLHDRARYPGTGMGLAICRKIVERHGGRIWIESAPERGAAFCFTLQATEKSAA